MKTSIGILAATAAVTLMCSACGDKGVGRAGKVTFDSPGEAAVAFAEAVRAGDKARMSALLGPDSEAMLAQDDKVQGTTERNAFLQAYDSVKVLVPTGPNSFELQVGPGRWPLPMPIVNTPGGWKFDSHIVAHELVLRRIGRNELAVIGVCKGFVAAQNDYAARFGAFATKLRSDPGKQDGLYWETKAGEPESPAGQMVALAEARGYAQETDAARSEPYRGYLYRRLDVQDPKKQFAILAYPAEWGASGIMTFIVNEKGEIYSKSLGPDTAKAAKDIHTFAPDDSWKRET